METEYKSKTQIKKEMKALQKLGERLVELLPEQIKNIEMPEKLREAVLFAKTIKSREARRRQLQYIGSLMREVDPEPIRQAIEKKDHQRQLATQAFQQLEQWRDGLIEGNNDLLEELCRRFPDTDRQRLRQLVRNACKERERNKPPKSSRALFRYLRELSESVVK